MTKFRAQNIVYSLAVLLLASCSLSSEKSTDPEVESSDQSATVKQSDNSESEAETIEPEEEKEEDFTEIELLSEATRSYDAGRFMISKNFFEKIIQNYPGSPLSLTAELKIADCLFFADRFVEAIPMYREFAKVHLKHEARPYALYKIAESFQKTYQGTKQDLTPLKEAIKQYLVLINEYPNSSYSKLATGDITKAEEDLLQSELSVIEFYERTGDEKSAENRKQELRKHFGHLNLYNKLFGAFKEEDIKLAAEEDTLTVPDVFTSPTPTIEASPSPLVIPSKEQSPSPSPLLTQMVPRPGNLKTLADLEIKKTEITPAIENTENIDSPNSDASLSTIPAIPAKDEASLKKNLNAKTFLTSQRCDQEDGILKIFLNFSSKPFLKSSTKDENAKQLTTVIFQEGFTTDILPAESNDKQWVNKPAIVCLEINNESVVIQEKIKVASDQKQFGPNSYLFVYINSSHVNKVSIVNGSTPESLAIVAQ